MAEDNAPELQKSLKSRHMTMISLGGVIGASLFVGSSAVIKTTGGLLDVNRRGVPVEAILLTSSIGFASTILSYLSPDKVFLFLVNSSGAIALFVYVPIALSELRMRRRLDREAPERLKVRMWLFPYLTYFAIAAMVAVIASMALVKDARAQLIPSFISLAVVLAAYRFKTRAERQTSRVPAGAR